MADDPKPRGCGCERCQKFWTSVQGKALDDQITRDAGELAAARA